MRAEWILIVVMATAACSERKPAESPATAVASASSPVAVSAATSSGTVRMVGLPDFSVLVQKQGPAVVNVISTRTPHTVARSATGDSADLKVGEWVAAIGSPFGFSNTITAGIVSAKGRTLPDEFFVPLIQTDVAVNPGNSGGPLLNLKDELVGINSMIYSGTGGYMGVSFAIPIEVALDVSKQLQATGTVSRGRLGVSIQEITKELALAFKLESTTGVLTASVEPESPAQKAGLRRGDVNLKYDGKALDVPFGVLVEAVEGPAEKAQIRRGDVIIAVDNTDLTSIRQFGEIVALQKPGTSVALLVRRGDASLYVAVEVGTG